MRITSALYSDFAHLNTEYPGVECVVVKTPDDLKEKDVLILHGGEDISPSYYKEKPCKWTRAPEEPSNRDKVEKALMERAIELGNPIFGICRGAQFLCIQAGGKLVQHVVGHEHGRHVLHILPEVEGQEFGRMIYTNTCHHQQMDLRAIPAEKKKLLAVHPKKDTERYEGGNAQRVWTQYEDPEIVYFPEIKGFAVQGHPEWLAVDSNLVQYCLQKSKELWKLQ